MRKLRQKLGILTNNTKKMTDLGFFFLFFFRSGVWIQSCRPQSTCILHRVTFIYLVKSLQWTRAGLALAMRRTPWGLCSTVHAFRPKLHCCGFPATAGQPARPAHIITLPSSPRLIISKNITGLLRYNSHTIQSFTYGVQFNGFQYIHRFVQPSPFAGHTN